MNITAHEEVVGDGLVLDFSGEIYAPKRTQAFTVGREADLKVDDNQYLHRTLLEFTFESGLWWIANVGQSISVSLSTGDGAYHAVLGPAARIPLVFPQLAVLFTAGPFTYELHIKNDLASFVAATPTEDPVHGEETIGNVSLTPSQQLLLVALCEHLLQDGTAVSSQIPSSAKVAERLGWPLTTFNRKLDNVCDKLDRAGVQGLRGGIGKLAVNRRARLAEYAVLSRLITVNDLALLDAADQAARQGAG